MQYKNKYDVEIAIESYQKQNGFISKLIMSCSGAVTEGMARLHKFIPKNWEK
jgi:hypothetical protein